MACIIVKTRRSQARPKTPYLSSLLFVLFVIITVRVSPRRHVGGHCRWHRRCASVECSRPSAPMSLFQRYGARQIGSMSHKGVLVRFHPRHSRIWRAIGKRLEARAARLFAGYHVPARNSSLLGGFRRFCRVASGIGDSRREPGNG